ncbi:zinc-binding dehydrogenase [Corynebacterium silvaticum]|nr:zinc-binding dehydrogenase [Corynebacterium silvaticum]
MTIVDEAEALVVDTNIVPAHAYLGILGLTGLTAYIGLKKVAEMKEGDAVFISGAAGAVGSAAGQIARHLGASFVVGSAGTDAKVERLKELGFDAAFNYRDGDVSAALAQAAPNGIDVYLIMSAATILKPQSTTSMSLAGQRYVGRSPNTIPKEKPLGHAICA